MEPGLHPLQSSLRPDAFRPHQAPDDEAAGHFESGSQDQLRARGGGPASRGRAAVLPQQGSQGQAEYQARHFFPSQIIDAFVQ